MSPQMPISCDITALEESVRREHTRNTEAVFKAINEIRELPDGYAFGLPAETEPIIRAGKFMARERLCCPFFHFELELEPDHKGTWLKVSGQKNVKQYIKENVLPTVKKAMN